MMPLALAHGHLILPHTCLDWPPKVAFHWSRKATTHFQNLTANICWTNITPSCNSSVGHVHLCWFQGQAPLACEFELKQFLECTQTQHDITLCQGFNEALRQCKIKKGETILKSPKPFTQSKTIQLYWCIHTGCCTVLKRAFHIEPEQRQGPEQGREEWVMYPFSGPKTVSGGVY